MIFKHLYNKTLLGLCGHSQIFFENKKEIKKKIRPTYPKNFGHVTVNKQFFFLGLRKTNEFM